MVTKKVDLPVAEAVRRRRDVLGLRREDLASRSGLSMWTITRVERGHDTTVGTLQLIAAALDSTVSDLLGGRSEAAS